MPNCKPRLACSSGCEIATITSDPRSRSVRGSNLITASFTKEISMSTTMANISATQVKDLREKTGAPMMDYKQGLTEAKGDMEQAVLILRKKGVSVAAKKATRVTSEGAVTSYIHAGGKIGVLLE